MHSLTAGESAIARLSVVKVVVSLLAGAVFPLAFAPFEWFWIVPISLALLYWVVQQAVNYKVAFRGGFIFGLGQFGVGVSWVQISIAKFGGVNLPLSILLTILFVAFLALFPALLAALLIRLRANYLLYPLGWVLFEWIRSAIFGGFPWLLLGDTAPGTFYSGLAPLVGSYGVSLFLATIALLLFNIVRSHNLRLSALLLLAMLWGSWGSSQLNWIEPVDKSLSVALIQGNIKQSEKWKLDNRATTLATYLEASPPENSVGEGVDLTIWPETAIPAFRFQLQDEFLTPLEIKLKSEQRYILSGIPLLDRERRGYLNSAILLGGINKSGVSDGEESNILAEYHKRKLVPFGEYLPLPKLLTPIFKFIQIPFSNFSRGAENQPLFFIGNTPLSVTICYEVAYSGLTFSQLPEAQLLVTLSNDGWFGDSLAPYQHLQIARMRALESARPILRATNSGISALIGADGEVVKQIPRSEFGVLEVTVKPTSGVTPYLWLRRYFEL
jgi:apolipoprotein N-acyltransferase